MKTIKKIVIFSNFCITKNKRIYLGTKKKKLQFMLRIHDNTTPKKPITLLIL